MRLGPAAATVLLLLVGCASDDAPDAGGGDDATVVSADPAIVADSSLTDPAEYASNDGSVPEEPGFVQVDANTATTDQLIGAFEANGIDDPATWAAQVIGHRPYATGEPSGREFDDLRAALADAGLDEFAVEAVVASLTVTR